MNLFFSGPTPLVSPLVFQNFHFHWLCNSVLGSCVAKVLPISSLALIDSGIRQEAQPVSTVTLDRKHLTNLFFSCPTPLDFQNLHWLCNSVLRSCVASVLPISFLVSINSRIRQEAQPAPNCTLCILTENLTNLFVPQRFHRKTAFFCKAIEQTFCCLIL